MVSLRPPCHMQFRFFFQIIAIKIGHITSLFPTDTQCYSAVFGAFAVITDCVKKHSAALNVV